MRTCFFILALIVTGCGSGAGPGELPPKEPPKTQPTVKLPEKPKGVATDQEKVRQWLKENTNSGKWEEVRWWETKDDSKAAGRAMRVCRLKFRTTGPFGGPVLQDVVFEVGERATPAGPAWQQTKERDFPD